MTESQHPDEPHATGLSSRLNWLRAGVLGANDGIVSVAAVVVGVASATASLHAVVTAGTAALVGGAVSMALGEYVSVSSARDNQLALIEKETAELRDFPDAEFDELVGLYEQKGLSGDTARRVARELTRRDALAAHLEIELGIDQDDIASPWHAALASAMSFLCGATLPMLAMLLAPASARVPVTMAATIAALAATGAAGARLGDAPVGRATLRVVIGGALALAATSAVGALFGTVAG